MPAGGVGEASSFRHIAENPQGFQLHEGNDIVKNGNIVKRVPE
jgi:hypothetical protein